MEKEHVQTALDMINEASVQRFIELIPHLCDQSLSCTAVFNVHVGKTNVIYINNIMLITK